MILKYTCLILLFALVACSPRRERRDPLLSIIIQRAFSDEFDLRAGVFKVHYSSRPDTSISFTLTEKEWESILDKYYALHLNEFRGKVTIGDDCHSMPKLYTTIRVRSKGSEQEIAIDQNCQDFGLFSRRKAKRVKVFLDFVMPILRDKPEIKNAKGSDVFYM